VSIFNYFRSKKTGNTAVAAKERLQIIVAHERGKRNQPDYIPQMQQEILDVIRKYVKVDQKDLSIQLDDSNNCSVLELNITLPD
jgi:cell division topological specificity factor